MVDFFGETSIGGMIQMRYEYATEVGTFWIIPDPENSKKVLLGIDNITIGIWDSAISAASDVYVQNTGWERWDLLQDVTGPEDLSEWERIEEEP
jgi:hypothetical protein